MTGRVNGVIYIIIPLPKQSQGLVISDKFSELTACTEFSKATHTGIILTSITCIVYFL